ncbi:DHH family phosphoesterase [Mesoplasma photuris]|uniref:DHH family phosphoesterase n=1 Tax=Mesoplasma photuris TaxID=217731 RepID=UPI0004E0EE0B|nr:bifunctional oligoribonuclease/PAP phosphatase NrnA [Mesoplasma photuris]
MINKKDAKTLVKKIKGHENIIIVKHQLPDWDAQGSAMGLAHIIKENFENKNIFVVGDRLNDDKDFLPKKKLTNDFIKSALVITVDTGNKARLDFDKYDLAGDTFKIDHHIDVDKYANNQIVMESAIACTEVVTLWAEMMKLEIPAAGAHNLYLGLLTDSGRFLFPKTNPVTFRVAARLLEQGADLKKAHDYIFVNDLKNRKWSNFAFSKMTLSKHGVASIVIKKEDYAGWDLDYNEVKGALATMSGMHEIVIWFTVIEMENGQIKVSLRSRDYDVNSVATKYNGGGHRVASGASLNSFDEISSLTKDLDKLVKNGKEGK